MIPIHTTVDRLMGQIYDYFYTLETEVSSFSEVTDSKIAVTIYRLMAYGHVSGHSVYFYSTSIDTCHCSILLSFCVVRTFL